MREQTVFPPDVLIEIHRRTQGIPRLINSVCDNLLLTSFRDGEPCPGDHRHAWTR
jgi:general secretion pathway protein A